MHLSLYTLFMLCSVLNLAAWGRAELIKRVPQQGAQPAQSSGQQPPAATGQPSATGSAAPAQPSGSVINTAPQLNNSQAASASGSGSNPLADLPTTGSFGNTIFPGAATFIQPTGSKSVSPLYRIDPKENVTFVWEFQSLLVRPVNLTLAAVGPRSATYTISQMDGGATSAVWHISDVPPSQPLMNGLYQIQLYDQRGPSAFPSPGYLAPATRLTIAFYSPESYGPMSGSDYCPTCFYASARRFAESYAGLGVAFSIACITSIIFIYGLLH